MGILHTVNRSPFEKNSLASCLRYAKKGSAVLLIEDGVYAALTGTAFEKTVTTAMEELAFYCLTADLKARGFAPDNTLDGIELVDYAGFVALAVEHEKVQAWL